MSFFSTLYGKPKTHLTMTQVRNTELKHSEEGQPLTRICENLASGHSGRERTVQGSATRGLLNV